MKEILKNTQIEFLKKSLSFYGVEFINKKTVEELMELGKEVIKDRKNKKIRRKNIIDETTDNLIVLQYQIIINEISKEEINSHIEFKLNRVKKKMKKELKKLRKLKK